MGNAFGRWECMALCCSDEAPDCQMESNVHAFMGGLGTCMCK